jgi:hypothetical protein
MRTKYTEYVFITIIVLVIEYGVRPVVSVSAPQKPSISSTLEIQWDRYIVLLSPA